MDEASPHGKRARRGLCHRAAEWGAVGELVAEGQEVLLKTALITCSFASRPNSLSWYFLVPDVALPLDKMCCSMPPTCCSRT